MKVLNRKCWVKNIALTYLPGNITYCLRTKNPQIFQSTPDPEFKMLCALLLLLQKSEIINFAIFKIDFRSLRLKL